MDASTIQTLLNQGGLAIALVLLLLLLIGGWRAFTTRKVVFGWQYDEERDDHEKDKAVLDKLTVAMNAMSEASTQRHRELQVVDERRHRQVMQALKRLPAQGGKGRELA